MSWFESFQLVMRSTVTTFREKVEDPERMLHQLLVDMEEEHERIRHGVAEAIADEILLGRQVDKAREESADWLARAKKAISRGDDASAKSALDRKLAADSRADGLATEHAKQKDQVEALQKSVRDLEDKIRQARNKRTLLLARMTRADSSRKINQALGRAESRSAFAQFDRLERKVDRAETIAEAYDRLDDRDTSHDELERQFEKAERAERLDRELAELKGSQPPDG